MSNDFHTMLIYARLRRRTAVEALLGALRNNPRRLVFLGMRQAGGFIYMRSSRGSSMQVIALNLVLNLRSLPKRFALAARSAWRPS